MSILRQVFPVLRSDGPWGSSEERKSTRNTSSSQNTPKTPWDAFLRKFPKGGDPFQGQKPKGLWLLAIPVILWAATGIYRVQPDEQGVVLLFGAWVRNAQPGLNYHLPQPIETVYTPKVTVMNRIDSGTKSRVSSEEAQESSSEQYMLTGDKNILEVTFSVLWTIKPGEVRDFLFNTRDPQDTIKLAAESAVREVIAQAPITMALTDGREILNQKAQKLLQGIVDDYRMGIQVVQVKLQDVNPPGPVIDAFRDVQSASADQERLQNQAEAYRRKVIPEARGQAARILQGAEAYREQVINKALGETKRFLSVLEEYRKAKEVTTRRLMLETMENVLQGAQKIIIDDQSTSGMVPYLPLPEIKKRSSKTSKQTQDNPLDADTSASSEMAS